MIIESDFKNKCESFLKDYIGSNVFWRPDSYFLHMSFLIKGMDNVMVEYRWNLYELRERIDPCKYTESVLCRIIDEIEKAKTKKTNNGKV